MSSGGGAVGGGGGAPSKDPPSLTSLPMGVATPSKENLPAGSSTYLVQNGGSLEDCYTNMFAVAELAGLRWRMYESTADGTTKDAAHFGDDKLLAAYGRLQSRNIWSVWRRTPRKEMPVQFDVPHLVLSEPKELWIFWFGSHEPEDIDNITNGLNKTHRGGEEDVPEEGGSISYDVRTLFFKAIHTRIESTYRRAGKFMRVGRWFYDPFLSYEELASRGSAEAYGRAHSHKFTVLGAGHVMVATCVQQQPALTRLSPFHLEEEDEALPLLLAPWAIAACLPPKKDRAEEDKDEDERQLQSWRDMHLFEDSIERPLEEKKKEKEDTEKMETDGGESSNSSDSAPLKEVERKKDENDLDDIMPKMITVEVRAQQIRWPSRYVLVKVADSRALASRRKSRKAFEKANQTHPAPTDNLITASTQKRTALVDSSMSDAALKGTQGPVEEATVAAANRAPVLNKMNYGMPVEQHAPGCICHTCQMKAAAAASGSGPPTPANAATPSTPHAVGSVPDSAPVLSPTPHSFSSPATPTKSGKKGRQRGGSTSRIEERRKNLRVLMAQRKYRGMREGSSSCSDLDDDDEVEKTDFGSWIPFRAEDIAQLNAYRELNTITAVPAPSSPSGEAPREMEALSVDDVDYDCSPFTPIHVLSPCESECVTAHIDMAELKKDPKKFEQLFARRENVDERQYASRPMGKEKITESDYFFDPTADMDKDVVVRKYHSRVRGDNKKRSSGVRTGPRPHPDSDDDDGDIKVEFCSREYNRKEWMEGPAVDIGAVDYKRMAKRRAKLTRIVDKAMRKNASSPLERRSPWPRDGKDEDYRVAALFEAVDEAPSEGEDGEEEGPLPREATVDGFNSATDSDAGEGTSGDYDDWREVHSVQPMETDVLSPPASNETNKNPRSVGPMPFSMITDDPMMVAHDVGDPSLNKIYPTPPSVLPPDMVQSPAAPVKKEEAEEELGTQSTSSEEDHELFHLSHPCTLYSEEANRKMFAPSASFTPSSIFFSSTASTSSSKYFRPHVIRKERLPRLPTFKRTASKKRKEKKVAAKSTLMTAIERHVNKVEMRQFASVSSGPPSILSQQMGHSVPGQIPNPAMMGAGYNLPGQHNPFPGGPMPGQMHPMGARGPPPPYGSTPPMHPYPQGPMQGYPPGAMMMGGAYGRMGHPSMPGYSPTPSPSYPQPMGMPPGYPSQGGYPMMTPQQQMYHQHQQQMLAQQQFRQQQGQYPGGLPQGAYPPGYPSPLSQQQPQPAAPPPTAASSFVVPALPPHNGSSFPPGSAESSPGNMLPSTSTAVAAVQGGSFMSAVSAASSMVAAGATVQMSAKRKEGGGLSVAMAVILQDTILDLHMDWIFDSTPTCSCFASIKAKEIGVYISPHRVLRLSPADQTSYIGPWHGFYMSSDMACTCAFSVVRHRALSMRAGLFVEDAREATGDENSVVLGDEDSKGHKWFDANSSSDRDLLDLLRTIAYTFDVGGFVAGIGGGMRTRKAIEPSYSVGEVGDCSTEYVISQLDSSERKGLGKGAMEAAALSIPSGDSDTRTPFISDWGVQVANEVVDPAESELQALLRELKPLLELAVKDSSTTDAPSYPVEGPLTWRSLSTKAIKSSALVEEEASAPEAVPFIQMATHREGIRIAPSATRFWETLQLAPHDSPKDVLYIAVVPDDNNIAEIARNYMRKFSKTYETRLRLGRHVPLIKGGATDDGVIRTYKCYGSNYGLTTQWLSDVSKYLGDTPSKPMLETIQKYCSGVEGILSKVLAEPYPIDNEESIFSRMFFRRMVKKTWIARERYRKDKIVNGPPRHDRDDEEGVPPSARGLPSSPEKPVAPSPALTPPADDNQPSWDPNMMGGGDMGGMGNMMGMPQQMPMMPQQVPQFPLQPPPDAEPEDLPSDDPGTLPHVIVVYLVTWPVFGNDGRNDVAARVAVQALLRAYNSVLHNLVPEKAVMVQVELLPVQRMMEVMGVAADMDRVDKEATTSTWNLVSALKHAEVNHIDRTVLEDLMKETALSVYGQPRLLRLDAVRSTMPMSMTRFGPASNLTDLVDHVTRNDAPGPTTFYKFHPSAFHLSSIPMLTAKSETKIQLNSPDEQTLFVSYCIVRGQFVVVAVTDGVGKISDSAIINIRPRPDQNNAKYRYSNKSSIREAMDRMWKYITGVICQEKRPWRLVIGKLGRMGHGEFKAWHSCLSKAKLKGFTTRLREACGACSSFAPSLLSACLVSTEAEPNLMLLPSSSTTFEKPTGEKGGGKGRPLHSPGDASCSHILVFNTSVMFQTGNVAEAAAEDDDFGMGFEIEIQDDMNEIMDDLLTGNQQPVAGIRGTHADSLYETQEQMADQPLASGWLVSTVPAPELPSWFWASCPSLKRRLPVHLRSSLHINEPALYRNDDMPSLNQKKDKEQESSHPLDSSNSDDVLRYVLEQYNHLSWLSIDPVTNDRRSCLPIHQQALLRLHSLVENLIL